MQIKPFRIEMTDFQLNDLRQRLDNTRWPEEMPGAGWQRGIPVQYLRRIARYWRDEYDWRRQEARLNQFPQYVATIEGQTIHFLHVRSTEPDARPLIITHGYPSSIAEFMDIIGPLTNPRAYGGNASDAFHLVIPSLPGFGFSTPVKEQGWALAKTARAFMQLMAALGYHRYYAHGGDIGAGITGMLASFDAGHVAGTHVISDPAAVALIGTPLDLPVDELSTAEQDHLKQLKEYQGSGRGYLQIQSTRPTTIGYGLTDSPVAQLAWIVEKFKEWSNESVAAADAVTFPEGVMDLDLLLTNVSIYWFTQSGASAAQFIYEVFHSHDWPMPSAVPQGWAVFNVKDSILRRLMDPGNKIGHWSTYAEGGHFAAMEAPELLVKDIRKFFGGLA